MKKQYWILLIILLVLIVGYLGRQSIKNLLTKIPALQSINNTTTSSSPSISTTSAKPTEKPITDIVVTKSNATKGDFVAGPPYGRALYIFDKDKPGVSNCTGDCLSQWPPYTTISPSSTLPANIGTMKKDGGIFQYTYKDMPLYYYAKDIEPGDVKGDSVNGVWHLVKP